MVPVVNWNGNDHWRNGEFRKKFVDENKNVETIEILDGTRGDV